MGSRRVASELGSHRLSEERPRRMQRFLLGAIVLLTLPVAATQVPVQRPPAPVITRVQKNPTSVAIQWKSGRPPFRVVRADEKDLTEAKEIRYLAEDLKDRRFVDREVTTGKRYWYRVYDRNSGPEIYQTLPENPVGGGELTVRGAGFSSKCSENSLSIDGEEWKLLKCSPTELVAKIPPMPLSGGLLVATPTGIAIPGDWLPSEASTWPEMSR